MTATSYAKKRAILMLTTPPTGLLVQVARETDDRVTALEEENTTLRENLATAGTDQHSGKQVSELVALVRQLTGSEH